MNHKTLAIAPIVVIAVILFVGANIGIMQAYTSQSGGIINNGGKQGPPGPPGPKGATGPKGARPPGPQGPE